MNETDLDFCARHNRDAFDEVIAPYVSAKLEQVVSRLSSKGLLGWLDASGCVWCLFDDEVFLRSGELGRHLQAKQGDACGVSRLERPHAASRLKRVQKLVEKGMPR